MEIAALLNQAQLNSLSSPSSSPSLTSLHASKKFHPNQTTNINLVPSSSSSSSSVSSSPQPSSTSSLVPENRHRKSNSVLHVREDSLDELEALFDPSRRTSRANLPPLHKRNLPSSFFTQPSNSTANSLKFRNSHRFNHHHSHHVRQISIDQPTYSSAKSSNKEVPIQISNVIGNPMSPFNGGIFNGNQTNGNGLLATTNSNLQQISSSTGLNNHLRSISEPVNMMNMNVSQIQIEQHQQQPLQQLHQNILNNSQNSQLPYGWQSAKTSDNKIYYINHLTKETSWTLPNQVSFQQQQHFDLNEDNFDLISLASTNSTPPSSLLINANQNALINDSETLNSNSSKLQSNTIAPRMNPLVSVDNQAGAINKNISNSNSGLLSIQSSNSSISSSASSLSSSSSVSSHSGSFSQDELQFNEFNSQQSQLKHHHSHHHHHHPHHHHPYLTQHQQQQANNFHNQINTNSTSNSSQEVPPIQLSIQNLNVLKSLSDYQQKVEYLLKLTPIPSGWQRSQTDQGEIFFINHTTRSTCWDPRLKIVENYLQKHEQVLHQQQQQLHPHHHGSDCNALHPMTQQTIPMYQQQLNNRSNSTGAVSSSSCTSSNSASPLFMLNSSGSGATNNVLINSNNNSINTASNEIAGIENGLMQQQASEFPAMLEANFESNFQHQERINTLIDIITKKKELIKSLNELNKKESFLRSQIDIYGPSFSNEQLNADVLYTGSSSSNGQINTLSSQQTNANFVKREENELNSNEVFNKANNKEKANRSYSPNKTKTLQKNDLKSNYSNLEDENVNERSSDDDEIDLSNPEMTFISSENNENINEQVNVNNSKFLQFNPLINVNNTNSNLKFNKKTRPGSDDEEADLDTVNNLYNKLLIHNTNKNFNNIKMDENVSNKLNEDQVCLF